mgnify:CR=1 FL=1
MDVAVSMVEAYLQVNGYFTVTEYPVLETLRHGDVRTATDIDVLAFRFARVGAAPKRGGRRRATVGPVVREPDSALGVEAARPDMIIGEVKQGAARLNPAMRDPGVLAAALVRFGCCDMGAAEDVVQRLLTSGAARTGAGHTIRMVAFGSSPGRAGGPFRVVGLDHVAAYLRRNLREHRSVLGHAQLTQPTLALLALLDKSERPRRRG